ncbi:hypothetical protein PRIPAC_91752 [Pristionchus pacificus]|uniref:Uncharacterized protein n=1 Tax=Pristionchus pacificus TaxID=54126 RepID=A0A2A6BA05_PRIPA|nr:hypothetical protein PRIPAC_91752 [Pristionchus pacificus]|eukprot:PDM62709.1 hypothetical protein PRIPAC_49924 [Pristionchus pacificus]
MATDSVHGYPTAAVSPRMSRKRENSPLGPYAPAKIAKVDDRGMQQCIFNDEAASNQELTTMSASKSDGIKSLDTLPAIPMNAICLFLVDAEDYKALDSLRKINKGCKAAVDSFLNQKKNILPMDIIEIECVRDNFHVTLVMQIDTCRLRPNLKHVKSAAQHCYASSKKYIYLYGNNDTTRIHFSIKLDNDEILMDAFYKVVGTMELDKDLPVNDELSSELFSIIQNHSIQSLKFDHQPHLQGCVLTDPMGFVERLSLLMKSVEISQHQNQRAPLLFNIPHTDWENLAHRLKKGTVDHRGVGVPSPPVITSGCTGPHVDRTSCR